MFRLSQKCIRHKIFYRTCSRCKVNKSRSQKQIGAKSFAWKKRLVNLRAQYVWLNRHCVRSTRCNWCKKDVSLTYIRWKNKSGKYYRQKSDWERVCYGCFSKHIQI